MIDALTENPQWLAVAALCALAPTALFPVLAAFASMPHSLMAHRKPMRGRCLDGVDLEILVTAYREGGLLGQTLDSIMEACAALNHPLPGFTANITVGLHGADEVTRAAFASYASRPGLRFHLRSIDGPSQGKWPKLEHLVSQSNGRWCALVDAGSVWPADLLLGAARHMNATGPAGLAPGYCPVSVSRPGRVFWVFESVLKRMENIAGGPVSVHGATVFYRTGELRRAMEALAGGNWLNDDVAIAAMVRAESEIIYAGPELSVSDLGAFGDAAVEGNRRRRMMEGNLQWIGALWPRLWRRNPIAAIVACRRVARTFWAPLAVFGAFSAAMALRSLGPVALCAFAPVFVIMSRAGPRAAFWASVSAPFSIMRRQKGAVRWV